MDGVARRAGFWIGAVTFAVTGWPAFLPRDHQLITAFTDDSFFYFNIARHVAGGDGFTFDGIHATNGFQPLWLFILVPIFRWTHETYLPLRCIILLQSGLLTFAGVLAWRILRPRIPVAAAAAIPLLLIGLPGARLLWCGMESALFLALLVITWRAWLRIEEKREATARDWQLCGWCCALLFLARLEGGAALIVALAMGALKVKRSPRLLPSLAALAAPPALVACAYLAWNRIGFGTWLPISGKVKMHWVGHQNIRDRLLGTFDVPWPGRRVLAWIFGDPRLPAWVVIGCGLACLGSLVLAWRWRGPIARSLREAGAGFVVATCAGVALIDQVLIGPFLGEWAFVSSYLLTAIAIGLAVTKFPRVRQAVLVGALLLCLWHVPAFARKASHWEDTFDGRSLLLAEWVRGQTRPGERVASLYAGVLGYFGERTVINLDGLVNSIDYYQRVLKGDEWESYLRGEDVVWLADSGCNLDTPFKFSLEWMGKRIKGSRCYALVHIMRDPGLPENCGRLVWKTSWDQCGR